MKKLIALAVCMLPILAFAQKNDLVSVKQYLEKYSNVQNYQFVNIHEQMLTELEDSKDLDNTTIKLLSKLDFIQILEYKPKKVSTESSNSSVSSGKSVISVASSVAGVSSRRSKHNPRGGNIYYVEGVRIRGSQHLLGGRAKSEIDLSDFKQIWKNEQDDNIALYRKKAFGSNKSEYLLLKGNKIVSLKGKIKLDNAEEIEVLKNKLVELLDIKEPTKNENQDCEKELIALKKVLKSYMRQVDSLNQVNLKLENEVKVLTKEAQKHLDVNKAPDHKSNEAKASESIDIVEELPKFQGKYDLAYFRKYIQKRFVYPEKAKNKYLTGVVFASFVINKEGQIGQIEILRSLSPELDEEVVRVLKESPMWTPAKRRGKPVDITMSIPIKFQ